MNPESKEDFPCFPGEVKTLVKKREWDQLVKLYGSYTNLGASPLTELSQRFSKEEKEYYLWYKALEKEINDLADFSFVLGLLTKVRKHLLLAVLKQTNDPRVEKIERMLQKVPRVWKMIEDPLSFGFTIAEALRDMKAGVEVYQKLKSIGVFMHFSFIPSNLIEQVDFFDEIEYSKNLEREVGKLVLDECRDMTGYFLKEEKWPYVEIDPPHLDAFKYRLKFLRDHFPKFYQPFSELSTILFPLL